MNKKNVTVLERVATDRAYQNQVLQLENRTDYKLKVQSVIPRIETPTELDLVVNSGITLKNTHGITLPINVADKLLSKRIQNSKQHGIVTSSVDQPFVDMLQNALIVITPDAHCLAYKPTYADYLDFLKSIAGKLDFVSNLKKAFKDKKRNNKIYESAWATLVENDKEIVKLAETFLLHQAGLYGRPQIGFTRMIEGYSQESVDHAAALNVEANTICAARHWVKTLNLCIGPSALSKVSIIKRIKSDVLEKGKFGEDFDFAYISFPNYGIRNSIAQWRNMELLLGMIDTLREHNIQVIVGTVDWAFAEVCMARGIPYASTSISGRIAMAFRQSKEGGPEQYGKVPIPDLYDWQDFYSFNDDFMDEKIYGQLYPYYSPSATQLNGQNLLSYKPKAINIIRRQIFLEAVENQNQYRIAAAQKGELVEGTIKRLWQSSKPDYTKFLSFDPYAISKT